MGGNAFPEFKDRIVRLDAYEYMEFMNKTLDSLRAYPQDGGTVFSEILSYSSKESFGDLDILYTHLDNKSPLSPQIMKSILNAEEMVVNGPVVSYAVPVKDNRLFQVDLIHVGVDHFDFAYSYFAYNDLGNLIGRIFHRAGLKFGHKGLQYLVREEGNNNHMIREITITQSWKEALELVGYDYNRWLEGFETLEDVFKYAVSIPLANRTIFRLDEMNHAARIRDRKRKTYQQFLQWVNDPINGISEFEEVSKTLLRGSMLKKLFNQYPSFLEEYIQIQDEISRKKQAKMKFNGQLVMDLTGLKDKELGHFMKNFTKTIIQEKQMPFTNWVLETNQEEIVSEIQSYIIQRIAILTDHVV